MRRRAFYYVDRYQRYGNVLLWGYLMILSVPGDCVVEWWGNRWVMNWKKEMEEAIAVQSRYCPSICSGGLSKNTGNFSQSCGCPGCCSNLALPVRILRTPTQPVWLRVYGCVYVCVSDVYWTMHHCDNWRIKNQIDATYYFIVLLIGWTCFGHYYAHHQELATMMLITTYSKPMYVQFHIHNTNEH